MYSVSVFMALKSNESAVEWLKYIGTCIKDATILNKIKSS